MTIYDHRNTPPTAHSAAAGRCVVVAGVSIPQPYSNLPSGVYPDGGADQVPAGQVATAWTRVVRDGLSVAVPTCEPAPDQLATRAAALWADADVQGAVSGVLAAVQAVAALGVDIADWSFQGVTAAAEAAMGTGDKLAILTASVALRTAWDRLVYHAADMRTADRLWPYLYDIAMKL
jgi:hypothetical protein